MALAREAYQSLESIVGKENISDDPVILESYTWTWLNELSVQFAPHKWGHRPAAAVLPGSTEEVQAIVKACNRYRVKYKAFGTGYGSQAFPGQDGVVVVDLRRMNRILEIDEKNKYAVVEPYVTWMQLQAEAYKKGLATTQIQGGSQCSVLASVTSCYGMNILGTHGGYNARNALGVEWVLPTGEVLRLGPSESWFTGDGPGPSLRGIMRGNSGALGGLGIFTKCAIKLHHWPGPARLESEKAPQPLSFFSPYLLKKIELCGVFSPIFPGWENIIEFMYKAVDSEIAYCIFSAGGPERMIGVMGVGGKEAVEFAQTMLSFMEPMKEQLKYQVIIMLFASTPQEYEYKQKVLNQILTETGGEIQAMMEDLKIGDRSMKDVLGSFMTTFVFGNDTHMVHGMGGGFAITSGYGGTCESVARYMFPAGEMLKEKYMKKGKILNDGVNTFYFNLFDNAPIIYSEIEFHYDQADPESVTAAREMINDEWKYKEGKKYGFEHTDICLSMWSPVTPWQKRVNKLGELSGNFHIWQEKIKQAFDPNDVCDRSTYGVGYLGKRLLEPARRKKSLAGRKTKVGAKTKKK